MFYCFEGSGTINGKPIQKQHICRCDTTVGTTAKIEAGPSGYRMMVFTGKMTREDVVWHGPFVCADKKQLSEVFMQHQMGKFPPVRVPYDYKDASQTPTHK